MYEDLIKRGRRPGAGRSAYGPWFRGVRLALPGMAVPRCAQRVRQSRLLLLLVIATAVLGYGSIALGWRCSAQAHEGDVERAGTSA